MTGFDSLVDVADKLGIIKAVKAKLLKQPDPAAEKLVIALEEISKVYSALDTEISRCLSTYFDPAQASDIISAERKNLVELEGGEIVARMSKARGHCSKIMNIYQKYLSPWFSKVLSPQESQMLQDLFMSLDEFDGQMIQSIQDASQWLADEAHQTLDLVDASPPQYDKANQRIGKARRDIFKKRRAISAAMRSLLDLQAEFIGVSGAI